MYADSRVERPEWWPSEWEWCAGALAAQKRARLEDFFCSMRDWKAHREVRDLMKCQETEVKSSMCHHDITH